MFDKIESIIEHLSKIEDQSLCVKQKAVFFKYLRVNTQLNPTFPKDLIFEVSNFTKFVKSNLSYFKNGFGQNHKIEKDKFNLIY